MDRRRDTPRVMADRFARSLKVVRVIARLNVGGPARHVVLLSRGLVARGYETVLAHGAVDDGEASLERLAAEAGVCTVKLPELGRRIRLLSDVRASLALMRLLLSERPDIVHTHTAKAGTLGRLAATVFNLGRGRRHRCAVVHTFHGHVFTGYFGPLATLLVRLVERALARLTDCIVAISPEQKRDLVERFRIAPATKTVVVPLGLDLEPLLNSAPDGGSLRAELGIDPAAIVLGYVGRFVPIKDLTILLDAFSLASKEASQLALLMVGDGPLRQSLETRVAASGLAGRVRFLGWRDDLPTVYATMDACVLSSRNEGTPVAAIEAMAAGKPIVATAVGGVPDVVHDAITGRLVPAGDVQAMADALLWLVRHPEERRRMGVMARRDVAGRYGHERLVDDFDRLYRELLATKRQVSVPLRRAAELK